jgi:Ca2+-binding EF-hand superfamily protein
MNAMQWSFFQPFKEFFMTSSPSHKTVRKQAQKHAQQAATSFVTRHFNTFSVAIVTLAALHMNPALAQMSAPAKPAEMSAKLQEAFMRADKNADGKLSKEEAAVMPAIAEGFDKADVDKDSFLSKAEFMEIAKE